MKKIITVMICFMLIAASLASCGTAPVKKEPEPTVEEKISLSPWFTKQSFVKGDSNLPYWLYIPENAEANMPLIVALHCSYMKADDSLSAEENLDIMTEPEKKDITSYIYNGEFGKIPAYVIMPQTSAASRGWAKRGEELKGLIEECIDRFEIDPERVSLIGYSMGGTGALELAAVYPEVFDRVVAVAGGLDGVTNNNIPYIKDKGRMDLSEKNFPELRIPTKKEPSVYEPEKMKYAYAPEDSTAFTATPEEKNAAAEFEAYRIKDTADKLKNDGASVSVWLLIGENDTEVSPTVTKGLYDGLKDISRCDIIPECGHSGILNTVLEKSGQIREFLVN